MNVEELGLRPAVVNRLASNGITKVEQLEQMREVDVIVIWGIGLMSLREIHAALRRVGKDFKPFEKRILSVR